jgi:hypothetical protein
MRYLALWRVVSCLWCVELWVNTCWSLWLIVARRVISWVWAYFEPWVCHLLRRAFTLSVWLMARCCKRVVRRLSMWILVPHVTLVFSTCCQAMYRSFWGCSFCQRCDRVFERIFTFSIWFYSLSTTKLDLVLKSTSTYAYQQIIIPTRLRTQTYTNLHSKESPNRVGRYQQDYLLIFYRIVIQLLPKRSKGLLLSMEVQHSHFAESLRLNNNKTGGCVNITTRLLIYI